MWNISNGEIIKLLVNLFNLITEHIIKYYWQWQGVAFVQMYQYVYVENIENSGCKTRKNYRIFSISPFYVEKIMILGKMYLLLVIF